jgi:hypothetical protein
VPELVLLGFEVPAVVLGGGDFQGELRDDLQAVDLEPADLLGVVGQDADAAQADVAQDLGADAVVTPVHRETEDLVGLGGVEAFVQEAVGMQLVLQADAPALLAQVHDGPPALAGDHLHRGPQLVAAFTSHRAEDIARKTLGVHAHQDRLVDFGHAAGGIHLADAAPA